MRRGMWSWLGEKTGVPVGANDYSPIRPAGAPCFEPLEPRLLLNADLSTLQPLLTLNVPSPEQEIHVSLEQRDSDSQAGSSPLLTIDVASAERIDQPASASLSSETPVASVECGVLAEETEADSSGITQDDSAAPVLSAQQDNVPASEALPIEIRGPPTLPGLRLVDPDISNWQGQIVYLDFDGDPNVTYHGPVMVGPFDGPAFQAAGELAGQEEAIIGQILSNLNHIFVGSGVVFATTRSEACLPYSTIYIGGDDSAFRQYGSFLGLAEQVDVGNLNPTDEGLVFSTQVTGCLVEGYATNLAGIIAHEAGHLLGYAHDGDKAGGEAAIEALAAQTFTITDAYIVIDQDVDKDTFGRRFDFHWSSQASYGTATVTAEIWADSWEAGINDRKVAEKTYTITGTNAWQSINDILTTAPEPDLDHRTWDLYIILKNSELEVDRYGVWPLQNDDENLNDVKLELPTEDDRGWTFLVYMNADNDLSGKDGLPYYDYATADLKQMQTVDYKEGTLSTVVLVDYKDDDTYRGLIAYDDPATDEPPLPSIGECDMGAMETLRDFISWGTANYPAQRYALVLWDHGSGFLSGVGTGVECLLVDEIREAIDASNVTVNLVGMNYLAASCEVSKQSAYRFHAASRGE